MEKDYSKNMDAVVTYSDFLTKVVDIRKEINDDDVKKAFEHFDKDGSGKIDMKDMHSLIQRRGHEHLHAATLMEEVENSILQNQNSMKGASVNYNKKMHSREEIGLGTFKNYMLSDDNVSDMSDYTLKSSYIEVDQNDRNANFEDGRFMSAAGINEDKEWKKTNEFSSNLMNYHEDGEEEKFD